jgi:putative peptidoglycan lipid II flippase
VFLQRGKGAAAAGIALALSVSSAVNTVILFALLYRKQKELKKDRIVKNTCVYALKITILSIIASIPIILLRERINFFLSCALFAIAGIILLLTVRDKNLIHVLKALRALFVRTLLTRGKEK